MTDKSGLYTFWLKVVENANFTNHSMVHPRREEGVNSGWVD